MDIDIIMYPQRESTHLTATCREGDYAPFRSSQTKKTKNKLAELQKSEIYYLRRFLYRP